MSKAFSAHGRSLLGHPLWEVANIIASLIGIFGFITGISSIPVMWSIGKSQTSDASATWFGGSIPFLVSIPVFVISLLFVYGVYFLMLIRINHWLYLRGIITRSVYSFEKTPSDTFTEAFFMIFGATLAVLLFQAFFDATVFLSALVNKIGVGLMTGLLTFGVVGFVLFLFLLSTGARDAGARLAIGEQERLR